VTLISKLLGKPDGGASASAEAVAIGARRRAGRSARIDYCRLLSQADVDLSESELEAAWKSLRESMALVPEGEVLLTATDPDSFCENSSLAATVSISLPSYHVDRFCVSNEEFLEFVRAGGYLEDHLWPSEILSNVLQFVDSTDQPGPRYWIDGHPPRDLLQHPVTGICWYEANAFAHWIGKRLPSPAEWQWAAVWAGGPNTASAQRRYPWGDSFDPSRCNTWNSGLGRTVVVDEYYSGCTPNGVYQLIGNVWEWTSSLLECDESSHGDRILTEYPLAEIRGGAFDTYFSSQVTAQFRTGQSLLFRGANVGFRCCVAADRLVTSSDPFAFLTDEAEQ